MKYQILGLGSQSTLSLKKKSSNFYTLADIYFSTIFDDLAILQEALYSLLMHLEIMNLPNFHYLP